MGPGSRPGRRVERATPYFTTAISRKDFRARSHYGVQCTNRKQDKPTVSFVHGTAPHKETRKFPPQGSIYIGTVRIALLRQIRFVPRTDSRGTNIMWNDQLDAKLLRLRREGLSFAEAAERMGVSRNTVLGRAQRLAGKKFPSQTARSELRRRANDARARQAAAKAKVISRKLKKDLASGVPRNVAVRTALDLGAAPKLVAGIIGVSSQRVRQIMRES
jgi:DNA-binding Lrp family transcriptional regulator